MATEDTPTSTPPYIPWRTFTGALDQLAQHMPNRIDRSAFPGQSGAGQTQLLIAFRFFGLIADDGKPTTALLGLAVADEAARKSALRKLVEKRYDDLFALNLEKTTPSEFAEQMTKSYNITGDTRLKATRFFLSAASYLGVTVSPLLMRDKTTSGNGNAAPRRRRVVRTARLESAQESAQMAHELGEDEPPSVDQRTVALKSGGVLTLSTTTQFMSLSKEDRAFVFDLIDKMTEYEAQSQKAAS